MVAWFVAPALRARSKFAKRSRRVVAREEGFALWRGRRILSCGGGVVVLVPRGDRRLRNAAAGCGTGGGFGLVAVGLDCWSVGFVGLFVVVVFGGGFCFT